MDALEFFAQHPVFTHEEFAQHSSAQGSANLNTQRATLAYHLKKHHIMRIRRGLFVSVPIASHRSSEEILIDPFLIAGRIANDAVIAYHSAFDFHGISYSTYHQFTFMSANNIRPFTFQQTKYICTSFPKTLIEKNKIGFEVITAERQGMNIKVTSLERSIVDALDRPDYAGGWEEIWRSALHIPILNLDKVIEYAMLLNNATTCAKLGFFLEQNKEHFNIDEKTLNLLEQKKPKGIHFLERNKRESGKLIKRWNLVIPDYIINQAWEEPTNDDV